MWSVLFGNVLLSKHTRIQPQFFIGQEPNGDFTQRPRSPTAAETGRRLRILRPINVAYPACSAGRRFAWIVLFASLIGLRSQDAGKSFGQASH